MNTTQMNGSVRRNVLLTLLVMSVLGGYLRFAWAQSADPCAIYPKQNVTIPQGTPTAKLITGVLNKQIYICQISVAQAAATPGLTLSYGEVVAATPCATATPGATLGVYGSGPDLTATIGTGNSTILTIPAAAGTPVVDVCGLVAGATGILGGHISYVQR